MNNILSNLFFQGFTTAHLDAVMTAVEHSADPSMVLELTRQWIPETVSDDFNRKLVEGDEEALREAKDTLNAVLGAARGSDLIKQSRRFLEKSPATKTVEALFPATDFAKVLGSKKESPRTSVPLFLLPQETRRPTLFSEFGGFSQRVSSQDPSKGVESGSVSQTKMDPLALARQANYKGAAQAYEREKDYVNQAWMLKKYGDQLVLEERFEEASTILQEAADAYLQAGEPFNADIVSEYRSYLLSRMGIAVSTEEKKEQMEKKFDVKAIDPEKLNKIIAAAFSGKLDFEALVVDELVSATVLFVGILTIKSNLSQLDESNEELIWWRVWCLIRWALLEHIPLKDIFETCKKYGSRNSNDVFSLLTHLELFVGLKSVLSWEKRIDPSIVESDTYKEREKILERIQGGLIEIVPQRKRLFPSLYHRGGELYDLQVPCVEEESLPFEPPLLFEIAVQELLGRLRGVLFHGLDVNSKDAEQFATKELLETFTGRFGEKTVKEWSWRQDTAEQNKIVQQISKLASLKMADNAPLFPAELIVSLEEKVKEFSPRQSALKGEGPSIINEIRGIASLLNIFSGINLEEEAKEMLNGMDHGPYERYLFLGDASPIVLRFSWSEPNETIEKFESGDRDFGGKSVPSYYVAQLLYYFYLRCLGRARQDAQLIEKANHVLQTLFSNPLLSQPDCLALLTVGMNKEIVLEGKPELGRRSRAADKYLADSRENLRRRKLASEELHEEKELEKLRGFKLEAGPELKEEDIILNRGAMIYHLTGNLKEAFDQMVALGAREDLLGKLFKWHGDRQMAQENYSEAIHGYQSAAQRFAIAEDFFSAETMRVYQAYAQKRVSVQGVDAETIVPIVAADWNLGRWQSEIWKNRDLVTLLLKQSGVAVSDDIRLPNLLARRILRLLAFCYLEGIPSEQLHSVLENYKFWSYEGDKKLTTIGMEICKNHFKEKEGRYPTSVELQNHFAEWLRAHSITSLLLQMEVYALLESQMKKEFLTFPPIGQSAEYRQRRRMVDDILQGNVEIRVGYRQEMPEAVGMTQAVGGGRHRVWIRFDDTEAPMLDLLTVSAGTPQNLGEVAAHEIWGHARFRQFQMIWGDDVEEERMARVAALRHYFANRFGADGGLHYARHAMTFNWKSSLSLLDNMKGVNTILVSPVHGGLSLFPEEEVEPLRKILEEAPVGDMVYQIALDPDAQREGEYDEIFRMIEGLRYMDGSAHLLCASITHPNIKKCFEDIAQALKESRYHTEQIRLIERPEHSWTIPLSTDVEETAKLLEERGVELDGMFFSVYRPEKVREFLLSKEGKKHCPKHMIEAYSFAVVIYYHYLRTMAGYLDDPKLEKRSREFLEEVIFKSHLKESLSRYLMDHQYIHGHYGTGHS